MKKMYETPVLTAEEFDLIDVIAASAPDEPQNPIPELTTKNSTFEGPEFEI
jgi:hypothetical protein